MPIKTNLPVDDKLLITIPSKLKEQIKTVAQYNRVSVSYFVRTVIGDYIRKNKNELKKAPANL